jgi:spore germination protein KB
LRDGGYYEGVLTPVVWLGEIICLAVIIPSLNKPGQALRVAFLAVIISGLIIVVNVVYSLLIFGSDLTAAFRYPLFNGIRIISIANFLERLEAVPTVLWIAGGFIKMSILRYAAVLGAAQCLGLKDYRPLALPVGAVVVAGSLLMYWDVLGTTRFLAEVWPFYGLTFEAVIPLLLFVLAIARGLGGKDKTN